MKRRELIVALAELLGLAACKLSHKRAAVAVPQVLPPRAQLEDERGGGAGKSGSTSRHRGPVVLDEEDDAQLGEGSGSRCYAPATLDLANIPVAAENFAIDYAFYGRSGLALFAFRLPKYSSAGLKGFYLVREDGRPVAFKAISPVDISKLRLNAQVLEGLPLTLGEYLYVVFDAELGLSRSSKRLRVLWTSEFRSKPCRGPHQGVAAKDLGFFTVLPEDDDIILDPSLDDFAAPRNSTRFRPVLALEGFIVTDIFGKVLAESGRQYTEFRYGNWLILYKDLGTHYARRILRLA